MPILILHFLYNYGGHGINKETSRIIIVLSISRSEQSLRDCEKDCERCDYIMI